MNNIKYDSILIVHKPLNERRTLSAAKAIFKDKRLMITSYDITFEEYFRKLDNMPLEDIINLISVVIGDIQRMIIYPQFGWQVENEVPEVVKEAYYCLKELGFSRYILSKEQIKELISRWGIVEGQREEYFC